MIRAGTLRKKITIQRKSTIVDDDGSVVYVWSNLNQVRANVEPIKGNELFISKTIKSEVDYYIIIRKVDIINADRIIYNSEIFDIKSIINEHEKSVKLLILAKKRTDDKLVAQRCDILLEDGASLLTENRNYLVMEG